MLQVVVGGKRVAIARHRVEAPLACVRAAAGEAGADGVGVRSDSMYAMRARTCSSFTWPWNAGITGW